MVPRGQPDLSGISGGKAKVFAAPLRCVQRRSTQPGAPRCTVGALLRDRNTPMNTRPAPGTRLPSYFISHGGGPWPWIDEMRGAMAPLAASLRGIAAEVAAGHGSPRAVLAISGHWEAPVFTAMATARPRMLYDYSGFPEHTYRISYPAPGAPGVAQRITELLQGAGIASAQDHERGYDHGTFAPLAVMYPQAEVPVLQLSLKHGYSPEEHLAVGRALAPLRDEGVLILGSGLSFHNLRLRGPAALAPSQAFDTWLHETLENSTPDERTARLLRWSSAPAARIAHPQEDHLLPLMVALGAAESEAATTAYHEVMAATGWTVSSWRFGNAI